MSIKSGDPKKFLFEFGIRIIPIYLIFFAIYRIFEITNLIYPLELLIANTVFFFVKFLNSGIFLQDNILMNIFMAEGKTVNLAIESICLGIIPILTFITLIFALPGIEFNKKIKPILLGSAIIFAANIFRLLLVIWVGLNYGAKMFDFYHLFVLKYDLLLLVLLLFAITMAKLLSKNNKKK
ncbi:MAG: hypothetical protein COT15_00510 [Candidatus Diapherotrites archaeon CG08_land_8_20_14_0_20_34_12]|nr:MAG: hypothetical protein COT15_00510 [Candidatus Diapherotrites archaeon CG08_land_8_20_14_0_20_34_12]